MNHNARVKFKQALMKLIDNHQEEFESSLGIPLFQVNSTDTNQFQVLISPNDAFEIGITPITEKNIKVR